MAKLQINPSELNVKSTMPHGVYHLAEEPELFEISRSNNFEFVIPSFADQKHKLVKAGFTGSTSNNRFIENAQEMLRLSVNASSIPHFTQRPIQVKRGNNTLNYAGVPEWGNHTIQCIDFIGADAKEILMAWQNLSYNVQTEKVGLVNDYKKECRLLEYSPDYQLLRTWIIHGCWVSEINESDYNAEDNGKRQIRVTIIYDKAEIDRSSEL